MEKELAHKLDVILEKLIDDVLKKEQDKLPDVFHSVHNISWIVIQSIVPYIRDEFRRQIIKVFQLITQLIKCLKDNDFYEVTKKLFQQRAQSRRSLRLINCSLCDHYRKMPSKQDPKQAHYKKYLKQLKRDRVELNSKMEHVVLQMKIRKLSDDDEQFVYRMKMKIKEKVNQMLLMQKHKLKCSIIFSLQATYINEKGQQVECQRNMNMRTKEVQMQKTFKNEVGKQTIVSNGTKRHIHQRSDFDENNEKIVEEDRVDEFGQRILIKKRFNALGEEISQEFEVVENDRLNSELKQIRQSQKRCTELQSDVIIDIGIQTEGQIPLFTQTQEQFQQKKQNSKIIIDKPDFNELDKEAFNKLQQGKGKKDLQFQEAVNQIKKFLNKGDGEEFNEYLSKLRQNHQTQCGEQCSHLLRFYAKLGFLIQKSALNRQVYKFQKVQLQAKESL